MHQNLCQRPSPGIEPRTVSSESRGLFATAELLVKHCMFHRSCMFLLSFPDIATWVTCIFAVQAMQARPMLSCSVCLCLCVSVTFVHSVKTINKSSDFFSPSCSHTILVFPYQTAWQYSDGNPPPLTWASNADGVDRNCDSEPIPGLTACC